MTPIEAAWVAGLLEGEGAFMLQSKKNGEYQAGRISVNMTDLDVLQKLQEYVRAGKINGPFIADPEKHKPFWRFNIDTRDDIDRICRDILPFMGARRSTKIATILDYYESHPRKLATHGTTHKYNLGCHCDACRAANAAKGRQYRAARKESAA